MKAPLDLGRSDEAELVFGIVAAVGTDLKHFEDVLQDLLKNRFNYRTNPIHISDILRGVDTGVAIDDADELGRVSTLMEAGDRYCQNAGRGDVLALHAAAKILAGREFDLIGADGAKIPRPLPRTAHILNSLKRPDEVQTLRRIYGPGFFSIGVYETRDERLDYFVSRKNIPPERAQELLERDESEPVRFGQNTRETFHLADVFVSLHPEKELRHDLNRFLDLVFGHPFHTPTEEEQAMFLAFSSALRSGDLSRQVGAVVVSAAGDLLGVGANDVPRHGGGLHWPVAGEDKRDLVIGHDSNEVMKRELVADALAIVEQELASLAAGGEGAAAIPELFRRLRGRVGGAEDPFKRSKLLDITEYGRAVHAEMEALLSCARIGVSTRDAILYATTFPCHNCAKHIIDAGIAEVVFVEPYEKSKALELYQGSIELADGRRDEGDEERTRRRAPVRFRPFVGIGPRRYVDLFSMNLGSGEPMIRKSKGGLKYDGWDSHRARPRSPMLAQSYLQNEDRVAAWFREEAIDADQEKDG